MAYIIPNEGESRILSGSFCVTGGIAGQNNMTASLISSALTLTATMTLSSVTHLTGGRGGNGICSATIQGSAWCIPWASAGSATISASGNASNGGFLFSFTAAPLISAVGYAVWDATKLVCYESFSDGPYYLSNAGDTVTVTPYIKLGSGTNN